MCVCVCFFFVFSDTETEIVHCSSRSESVVRFGSLANDLLPILEGQVGEVIVDASVILPKLHIEHLLLYN